MGIETITISGVITINHVGGWSWWIVCKNKIELFQNCVSCPISNSLNKIPEIIAPIASKEEGSSMANEDSWMLLKLFFLLLYFPWKVLKINLHEYIAVNKAVKIPIDEAKYPRLVPFKKANSIIASFE